MSEQPQSLWSLPFLGLTVAQWLWVAVIASVALAFERVLTRYVRKLAKKARLDPQVMNGAMLASRILILIFALASLTRVGGVSTDWFVAFSALGRAAMGFASQQTIGNFVAGLYLLAARPFKVGDLVRIGTIEGVVQEVTINYTKVLTIGNNFVSIFNLNTLQRDIANFLYWGDASHEIYCYTYEGVLDHGVSATKTGQILDSIFAEYDGRLPKRPTYMILRSGGFERVYMIYLYVRRPEEVFTLRPQITEELFKRWDKARGKDAD